MSAAAEAIREFLAPLLPGLLRSLRVSEAMDISFSIAASRLASLFWSSWFSST